MSAAGVRVDRSKLISLQDVPLPTSGKQMQSFLGFCNFFRKFIPAFATLSAPLDALRFQSSFLLNNIQAAAFVNLRNALFCAPLLAFPDFNRPFGLGTDASSVGLGCVLFQPTSDKWPDAPDSSCTVVSFFSRALSKSERNYSATKRELLAVVFGLDICRYYLWGGYSLCSPTTILCSFSSPGAMPRAFFNVGGIP